MPMDKLSHHAGVTPIPTVPSLDTLTYKIPETLYPRIDVGMRVMVPLGRRRITAIVTELDVTPPQDLACRDICDILDTIPVITADLLELARWMSSYYSVALGDVLSLAVGRGLTASSQRHVTLVDASVANSEVEKDITAVLAENPQGLTTTVLKRRLDNHKIDSMLTALAKRGAINIDDRLAHPSVRELHQTLVEVVALADDTIEEALFARAPKRREIYDYLCQQPGRRALLSDINRLFASPLSKLAALEAAGITRRRDHEIYRRLDIAGQVGKTVTLSGHQQAAVAAIIDGLGSFSPLLLQGVTSSGKTEVYLRSIAETLERGGSALVLVPEISLTHQLVERLVGRFGQTVAVLHSELSAGERWDQWRRICRREVQIVVGARSAVLAPLDRLMLIVVDEEHDGAYKQADGVRYNGRDVAIMRARQRGCPVVLGSATPAIETWHSAREGRYKHLILPERVTESPLPSIEVVDLRGRDIAATGGLSDHLCRLMTRNFGEKGQTLLFMNRRGLASSLQCYHCGAIVECKRCSVSMTVHQSAQRLRCHHCNATRSQPSHCPDCSADALVNLGIGTQRLEATVRGLLPQARVERLDRDISQRKGQAARLLRQWCNGEIDVLIGTQMIAKGHDAAGVTLVGVVQADLSLAVPDFRAAERTFQVLSQVAGRAGRGQRRGRVIFQTYRPDHFALAAAVAHDYNRFATSELAERRELGYPPITRMVLLRFEGANLKAAESLAQRAAEALHSLARKTDNLIVRGPAPAPIEKIKDRYRFQVQLRSNDGRLVRHAAVQCRERLAAAAKQARVRVLVDIDPLDMM